MKSQKVLKSIFGLIFICSSSAFAFDMVEIQRMIQEKMQAASTNGMMPQMYNMQQATVASPQMVIVSQEDLAGKIKTLGLASTYVNFDKRKEGFTIDQKPYIDPEGKIVKYGYDGMTGLVTYMAETVPGQYIIKTMQAKSDKEPIDIARATYQGGVWDVSTVTSKRVTGEAIAMGSRGFTVSRETGAITFDPTIGLKTAALPNGYTVAEYQNGDITQTREVLLEAVQEKAGSQTDELIGIFKTAGSLVGLSKTEDYGLLNLETGKLILFNISKDSKNRSDCVQKERINSVFNKCQKSISYEALYDQTGLPNTGHYFWRVVWMNTLSKKPIAITIENGVKQLIATDLTTGKRVLLKERMMGINQFKVHQDNQGKIIVDVQLGFINETIEDVENQLNILPAIQSS